MLIALLLAFTLDDPAAVPAATAAGTSVATHQTTATEAPRVPLFVRPAQAPTAQPRPPRSNALRFVWREHPSLRAGRIALRRYTCTPVIADCALNNGSSCPSRASTFASHKGSIRIAS